MKQALFDVTAITCLAGIPRLQLNCRLRFKTQRAEARPTFPDRALRCRSASPMATTWLPGYFLSIGVYETNSRVLSPPLLRCFCASLETYLHFPANCS